MEKICGKLTKYKILRMFRLIILQKCKKYIIVKRELMCKNILLIYNYTYFFFGKHIYF